MRRKSVIRFAAVGCMALSLCVCGVSAEEKTEKETAAAESQKNSGSTEYEVTDSLGRTVTIPAETSSYACIGPGALRLYCYVAEDAELVGVEDTEQSWGAEGRPYTMSIPDVESLPVIGPGGPGNAPDAELLYVADPDVIFTCYNTDISSVDELQDKTGIPVVAISYGQGRLFEEEFYNSLELIGTITGNDERVKEVIDYFETAKADLESRSESAAGSVRAYLGGQSNRGSHGIESTTGNYEIFNALHVINVVEEAGIEEYVMLDKEKILDMDPDVMILDAGGLELIKEDYAANPEYYDSLSAFKDGKVYLQMPFNYYSTNMEIALADAYYIGSVLYPEAFADIDPAEKFDEISNFFLGIDAYDRIAEQYYGGYQQVVLGE